MILLYFGAMRTYNIWKNLNCSDKMFIKEQKLITDQLQTITLTLKTIINGGCLGVCSYYKVLP